MIGLLVPAEQSESYTASRVIAADCQLAQSGGWGDGSIHRNVLGSKRTMGEAFRSQAIRRFSGRLYPPAWVMLKVCYCLRGFILLLGVQSQLRFG